MECQSNREPVPRGFLRPLLSPLGKACYGLLDRGLRARVGRIPGVSLVYRRFLKPLLFALPDDQGLVLVRFPDFAMYLDMNEMPGELSLGRPWEPATTFVFRNVVRPGDVVIDVGAHWGYYTILAATLCGSNGKVFAFEPHPRNYALLAKNIAANNLTNVVATEKAASDQKRRAKLFVAGNSMQHSVIHEPLEWRLTAVAVCQPIAVETITLDEFFRPSCVCPRLLKMDIEGAEPLALRGMDHLISQNPQMTVITEFNPHYLDADAANDLLKKLTSYGFKFMAIDDIADELAASSHEDTLRRFLSLPRGCVLNLFCARDQDLVARLIKTRN
ncbi:MAG: FkbM family methyltransferase [Terriglobia bacterium]|jgi:FkbM family methyltransferase